MSWYTIKSSKFEKPVKTKFGEFSAYEITVMDGEGAQVTCQLLQKPDTAEPMVDGRIHGYIEDSDFGFKFKKTQPEDGGSSTSYSSHSGASQPSTAGNNNDTQNQIIRQSMVKAAVDLCIANKGQKNIEVSTVLVVAEQLVEYATTGKMGQAGGSNTEIDAHLAEQVFFDQEPAK